MSRQLVRVGIVTVSDRAGKGVCEDAVTCGQT
jgi:hypothetical protein